MGNAFTCLKKTKDSATSALKDAVDTNGDGVVDDSEKKDAIGKVKKAGEAVVDVVGKVKNKPK